MKQYESALNKIAPMFYKLLQYREYFDKFNDLFFQYLLYIQKRVNKKILVTDTIWLPDPEFPELGLHYFIYYFIDAYILKSFLIEKTTNTRTVVFTKANNLRKYNVTFFVYIDQFIINLVINKFSFENEYPRINFLFGTPANCTYKDLFIALVGKDLYETLRASVK